MSKKVTHFLFLFLVLLLSPKIVNANYEAKFVADGTCSKKPGSTGNCFYSDTTFESLVQKTYWLDTGDEVTVITSKKPVAAPETGSGSECKTTFSYVQLIYKNNPYYGYACTDNIKVANVSDELKKEFQEAGFPESYWADLSILKEAHPKWTFIAIPTELDFQTAVNNMDVGNKSLYQSTSSNTQGYLSTKPEHYNWDTDKFKVYDGSSWYAASNETIAYYMDPRNFLSDMYLFQYESLAYEKNVQTLDAVKALLGNAYISKFADYFFEAGVTYEINPVYLASLSKVEVGGGTTAPAAVSGKEISCNLIDGEYPKYKGYYNFYNIGSTSGVGCSTYRGIRYAASQSLDENGKPKADNYGRKWNTEKKAVLGGANFIANSYVKRGQITSYFKKWNVVYNYSKKNGITSPPANYTHQYQQSVFAPTTEAEKTYRSYYSQGLIDSPFIFYIPVYKNMPESTSMPAKGNPNNRLKTITIDDKKISGYSSSTFNYKMTVPTDTDKIKVNATTINSAATVSGTGTINLKEGENKISLKVKAQNGDIQTYTLVVTRTPSTEPIVYPKVEEIIKETSYLTNGQYLYNFSLSTKVATFKEQILKISPTAVVTITTNKKEKTSDNVQTGDIITIVSGEDKWTKTAVIYGDVNGDSSIGVLDLLKVQKHILGSSMLSGATKEAADVNKDGNITVLDLLKVQKHILGDSAISQK